MKPKPIHSLSVYGLISVMLLAACLSNQTPHPDPPLSSNGGLTPPLSTDSKLEPPTQIPATLPLSSEQSPGAIINTPEPGSLPFEVLAFGEPTDGNPAPLTFAIQSAQDAAPMIESLPVTARQALEAYFAEEKTGLVVVMYAGEKPSSGFSIQILSIDSHQENNAPVLLVRYYIQAPDPNKGAAAVITYPYLIISLSSDLNSEHVRFEQVQP